MADVTPPTADIRVVVNWMINDPKGGFQEVKLQSSGGSPQFVSISAADVRNNPELKAVEKKVELSSATIDRQVSL